MDVIANEMKKPYPIDVIANEMKQSVTFPPAEIHSNLQSRRNRCHCEWNEAIRNFPASSKTFKSPVPSNAHGYRRCRLWMKMQFWKP